MLFSVDIVCAIAYNAKHVGAWLSLVERTVWDREVVGSNPSAPTNQQNLRTLRRFFCWLFFVKTMQW